MSRAEPRLAPPGEAAGPSVADAGAPPGRGCAPLTLEGFEWLALTRRAVRNFTPTPVPGELLERVLNAARWAPSGYNLQPTHMTVVTRPELKRRLCAACMSQRQVMEAPAVVVFSGDARVYRHNFAAMLACEAEAGNLTAAHESRLRAYVGLAFERGPAGFGWLWKALGPPLARWWRPVPSIPAVHLRYWLSKQVMLAGMNFMLAAHAAGLATVPMEGFCERRVKRAVGLPRWHVVPLVIPIGHSADDDLKKTRLPLAGMVHWERWSS